MYFLRLGDESIIGASPEMLVRCSNRALEYRPIAGTRRRGETEADDLRLGEECSDEKEVAEHVMLVDLGRNDLGRVSEYGSVRVEQLMFVERYSQVQHPFRACTPNFAATSTALMRWPPAFPRAVTGAPKIRAMQIIDTSSRHRAAFMRAQCSTWTMPTISIHASPFAPLNCVAAWPYGRSRRRDCCRLYPRGRISGMCEQGARDVSRNRIGGGRFVMQPDQSKRSGPIPQSLIRLITCCARPALALCCRRVAQNPAPNPERPKRQTRDRRIRRTKARSFEGASVEK